MICTTPTLVMFALLGVLSLPALATINFQHPTTIETGQHPVHVTLADLNNDSHLDIIATDLSGKILVLLGDGAGGFQRLPANKWVPSPDYLASADFNGDGNMDIAVSSRPSVYVLLGNGDGTFQPASIQGSGADQLVVGDFNNDHIADIAAANFIGPYVSILLGNGDGTFHAAPSFTTFSPFVAATDFNRDGNLDLAVPGSVYLGNGDGTFQAPRQYANGDLISVGDFNGDGLPDIVSVELGIGRIYLNLGHGDGTFTKTIQGNAGTSSDGITSGDVNGDGLADLIINDGGQDNSITIMGGRLDGTLAAPVTALTVVRPLSTALGDLNGDGNNDAVSVTNTGQVSVLLGNGNQTFNAPRAYIASSAAHMVTADLNGDGRLDLAYTRPLAESVAVMLGSANGFGRTVNYATNIIPESLAVGDVNNDGIPDLACSDFSANGGQGISILLGNGDGTFQPPSLFTENENDTTLVLADVNHDGNLDLLNVYIGLQVALGNGDGTFQRPLHVPTTGSIEAIAVADVNGDGNLDVIIGLSSNHGIAIYLGLGDGTFQSGIDLARGVSVVSLALGDFNRDGNRDIVAVDQLTGAYVYLGNGDGTFQAGGNYDPGNISPYLVATADFDGDGNLDFALTSGSSELSVYPGNGNGSFGAPLSFLEQSYPNALVAGDFNLDGKSDLAISNNEERGSILILKNTSY